MAGRRGRFRNRIYDDTTSAARCMWEVCADGGGGDGVSEVDAVPQFKLISEPVRGEEMTE